MKKLISTFLFFVSLITFSEVSFAMTAEQAAKTELDLPCGFSAQELASGLKGELVCLAEDFVAAEEKYGVNAVFLAALAAQESGWGRHCFRQNNIFGWSGKSFDSKSECIDFVALKIAEKYLSEEGRCFRGKTLYGVNVCYNGSEDWVFAVAGIMEKISKRAAGAAAPYKEEVCAEVFSEQPAAIDVYEDEETNPGEIRWICSYDSCPENTANGQCDLP